jgi:hypothetical protein
VDDRVDLGGLDDPGDQRVADVGPDELGALEVEVGLLQVDADDRLDIGVGLEPLGEPATEVAGDAGDQDALTHRQEG